MSLIVRDTTAADPETVLEYPDGGVFMGHFDCSALGSVTLTVEVYTQVHQASEEVLHSTWTLAGPTPTDPAVLEVGPIISACPVRMVVSGASSIPFWIESLGQVSTVEGAEGLFDATGSLDVLAEVRYPGTFYLLVDVAILASGDDLKLRLDSDLGGYLTCLYSLLEDAQTNLIATLGPLSAPEAARATLEQSAGSVEDFNWSLVRLG